MYSKPISHGDLRSSGFSATLTVKSWLIGSNSQMAQAETTFSAMYSALIVYYSSKKRRLPN
jgi:hypothetical protein